MADTKINRSFIPPTETEKVDSEVYPIVWSLGTNDHPWKNLYLSDYEIPEGETLKVIDVYNTLKDVSTIPKTDKNYGNILTVAQDKENLNWKSINDVLTTHATGTAISSALASIPVQRSEGDEDGVNLKSNYLKKDGFTALTIKNTLGNLPVKRAEADPDGNLFKEDYVNKEYLDKNYIHRVADTASSALTDQKLAEVCFTNSYKSLDDRPQIPKDIIGKDYLCLYTNGDEVESKGTHYKRYHEPLEVRLTADETQITANTTNIATNTSNIATNTTNIATNTSNITTVDNRVTALDAATVHWEDYATTSKAGIVKISTANGLNIGSNGTLTVDKATSSKVGVVKVNNGKGLEYNPSNGSIYMDAATTGQLGTVKIGSNINVSDGTISVATSDTSKLGLVKVGNNIQVDNGTISVNTGSTSNLGVVSTDSSTITNTSGKLSLTKANIVNALGYTPIETAHQPGEIFAVIGVGTNFSVTGCVPCDGSTYPATMYPNFWKDYLASGNLQTKGKLKTCSLVAYQGEIDSLNGQCAKWGVGKDSKGNNVFRVPTLPPGTLIQQRNADDKDPDRYAPGLPNIKGYFGISNYGSAGGAFYGAGDLSETIKSGSHSSNGIRFDASKGGSTIYNDDVDTVQPKAVCVQYYTCIVNMIPDKSFIDWSEWETAMEAKMDKKSWGKTQTSVNIDTPAVVIKNYISGKEGYRIWSDGYCEQWGYCENISKVTFKKKFLNTDYNISLSQATWGDGSLGIDTSTIATTGFSIGGHDVSGIFYWRACGYLASGQY